jgi:hypothetical protein
MNRTLKFVHVDGSVWIFCGQFLPSNAIGPRTYKWVVGSQARSWLIYLDVPDIEEMSDFTLFEILMAEVAQHSSWVLDVFLSNSKIRELRDFEVEVYGFHPEADFLPNFENSWVVPHTLEEQIEEAVYSVGKLVDSYPE